MTLEKQLTEEEKNHKPEGQKKGGNVSSGQSCKSVESIISQMN